MEQAKLEGSRKKLNKVGSALPAGLMFAGMVAVGGIVIYDEFTVSKHDAQEAIYAKYECLAGTSYALGQAAVEYADEVAQVTPTDITMDTLVFDMPPGISGDPLPRPNEATEAILIEDIGCETPKPFWGN